MNSNKIMLMACYLFSMQSIFAMIPVARMSALALAKTPAGAGVVSTVGLACMHLGIRYSSSLSEWVDKVPGGKKVNELSLRAHETTMSYWEKMKQVVTNRFQANNVSNVTTQTGAPGIDGVMQAAKTEAQQEATASGFLNFPKNTTNNQTTINHNYNAPTSFWDLFKDGGDKMKLGLGSFIGFSGGYGLRCAIETKQGPQEKIIIVQAPGQVATAAVN